MDPCKLKEPKVVDNALLEKCVKDQGPKGEAGRLAEIEGIPLDEVEEIRLEFMNILKIDHLWVLSSLTKLSLNNNLIEEIENLESLIHLKQLDLSFNKIAKIENLDALVNLEKLSFFENEIEIIENMDTLEKLTILSIGKNRIEDLDQIFYLRRFPNLKSLNLAGNPCAEMEDFRFFIALFLPQLAYYEYKMIRELEIELGNEMFSTKLRTVLEHEEKELAVKEKIAQELRDAELHSKSFVEYLNSSQLFDSLFKDDIDGNTLLEIGDEVREFYEEYAEQFNDLCKQIFEIGQQQYVIRQQEVDQFFSCVAEAKRKNQEDSIGHMELFLEKKAEIFYKIKREQDLLTKEQIAYEKLVERCEEFANEFDDILHNTWKVLMKLEMELYEQMEDVNKNFELSMTELGNVFIEAAQGIFSQIRALEVSYNENISESAGRFQTLVNLNEDIPVPEILQPIICDKEVLHNSLATSHDMHMQLIDNREDTLVNKARNWLSNLVSNLEKDEVKRNRSKVLEINHFLDVQREEFDDLNGDVGVAVDPELADVLD